MHRPYQLAEGGRSAYRSKQGAPNQISTFDHSRYKNNFYHFMPILAQLFKGPYQVFVNTSEPHKIPISAANLEFIDKIEDEIRKKEKDYMATHDFTRPEFEKEAIKLSHGLIYANLTDKQKDYILSLMPKITHFK